MSGRQRKPSAPKAGRRAPGRKRRPAEWIAAAFLALVAVVFIAVRVAPSIGWGTPTSSVPADVLEVGETLYQAGCAACHGVNGEGSNQPTIPAPPLDGSAHSWHHSDQQIIGLLRNGGTVMPAVGADWSDEEITAVLSFVKSRWAPWQRERQPGTIGE